MPGREAWTHLAPSGSTPILIRLGQDPRERAGQLPGLRGRVQSWGTPRTGPGAVGGVPSGSRPWPRRPATPPVPTGCGTGAYPVGSGCSPRLVDLASEVPRFDLTSSATSPGVGSGWPVTTPPLLLLPSGSELNGVEHYAVVTFER